jgi:hypothetical protein
MAKSLFRYVQDHGPALSRREASVKSRYDREAVKGSYNREAIDGPVTKIS